MSSILTQLSQLCLRFAARKQGDSTPYTRGFDYAMKTVIEDIEFTIKHLNRAGDYPTLGLEDLGLLARELGFDVTTGMGRIMISRPTPQCEGDKAIEAAFPTVEETPTAHCENCGLDLPPDMVDRVRMGEGDDDYASMCKKCQQTPTPTLTQVW